MGFFTPKDWQNSAATPISAAALEDLELRTTDYADEARSAVDARDFGVDLTGASDTSAEWQAAIEFATTEDRPLYLPPGTICGSVTIRSGLRMFGAPGFRTELRLPNLVDTGAIVGTLAGNPGAAAHDIVFEDLYFNGQQQDREVSSGGALLKSYGGSRWTLRRVKVANSTSYGIGFQGRPSTPTRPGPHEDVHMEQVWVTDCGYTGGTVGTPHSGTNNSMDNIDIKSSHRVVMKQVYSAYGGDAGFDVRSRRADYFGCFAYNNVGGFNLSSNAASVEYPDQDAYHTMHGGGVRSSTGIGIALQAEGIDADTHFDLVGVESSGNGGVGLYADEALSGESHVAIVGGKYKNNSSFGIQITGVDSLSIIGVVVTGNSGSGIRLENLEGAKVIGNTSTGNAYGIRSPSGTDNLIIRGNDFRSSSTSSVDLPEGNNRISNNLVDSTSIPSVASAATITLPEWGDVILVTGTTNIDNITRSYIGREVVLMFDGSLTLSHDGGGAGGSLWLAGGLAKNVTANDMLPLVCINSTYWFQSGPVVAIP